MSISAENKKQIILYLLEKIKQKHPSISKTVAEAFSINTNTVHTYINELVSHNFIRRVKRGQYELVTKAYEFELSRSRGELDDDMYALEHCLNQYISDLEVNVQQIWEYAFSEMINNTMDHSQAEKVRIVIEKNCLTTTVMIADNGVGIFQKIKDYFNFSSLDESICELFKGKLTTDSKNHSGEGIFFSSRLMDDFAIISSGKVFTNNKYDDSRTSDVTLLNSKGTIVLMSLSNFSHKTPKEIFEMYENDNGGFVRTKIPMKNVFDSSPVSRSQAKRVCNRLEKFQEVIIDFEGVEWIGQAFAHQLFVVFANEHNAIKLIPINMNDDIVKMYNHVTNEKL